jgi:serine/threonine-protein kinase
MAREDDLEWLHERARTAAGRVLGARLVGDPGSGKTRLLDEFRQHLENQGAWVAESGPDPYWAEVAYYAYRQAVLHLLRLSNANQLSQLSTDASPSAQRGLSEVFANVPHSMRGRSPLERRTDVAEGLRWALLKAEELAQGKSVVLIIDDLQRVDGSSRAAFADALGEPPPSSALILAAHTPGFESGWGAIHAARVLTGLPPSAVARVVRSRRPSDRSRAMPQVGTRGITPLYIEQLVRFLAEGGGEPSYKSPKPPTIPSGLRMTLIP